MARPLTIKQEKFCQTYIESDNAALAYESSYSAKNMSKNAIYCEASRLLSTPKIALRVQELQEALTEKHGISQDYMTYWYMKVVIRAEETGNLMAMKGALDSVAKMHGHLVERKQIDGNIDINHRAESVSETTGWIEGMLGRPESNQIEASLPN